MTFYSPDTGCPVDAEELFKLYEERDRLQSELTAARDEVERLRARLNDFGGRLTYGVLSQGEFVGWEDAYDDAVVLADSYGGTVFSIYAQRIRKQPDEEGER